MVLNVRVLRESFELVVGRAPDLTGRFYDALFERHPELRGMFGRNSRDTQERMLASALAAVIDRLEDAPWLQQTLGGLGAKHRGYGVSDEMYDWVGEALLATLSGAAGDQW